MKDSFAGAAAGEALARLMELVASLRGPGGCPWDQKQTLTSVAPYLLEEAFESLEAVEGGRSAEAMEELGDVLFQIVFLARLYEEQGLFDLAQVMDRVDRKMRSRHPHVFAGEGAEKMASAEQVAELWGRLKQKEPGKAGGGLLDGVPLSAPSLMVAQRMASRASRAGLLPATQEDPASPGLANQDPAQAGEALGRHLFFLASEAKAQGLDAEAQLRKINREFRVRVHWMEKTCRSQGCSLEDLDPRQLAGLWQKSAQHSPKGGPNRDQD